MEKEIQERLEILEKEVQNLKKQSEKLGEEVLPLAQIKKMPNNFLAFGGRYEEKGSSSIFGNNRLYILDLFATDNTTSSIIFSALGNQDRLCILKAIMRQNLTVGQIMEKCNLNTTGQAYHHLNSLEKAGLIEKHNEVYHFVAKRISAFILALASAYQFLDLAQENPNPINIENL